MDPAVENIFFSLTQKIDDIGIVEKGDGKNRLAVVGKGAVKRGAAVNAHSGRSARDSGPDGKRLIRGRCADGPGTA